MKEIRDFLILTILLSLIILLFFPFWKFPKITGPYSIGQRSFHWVDTNRKEIYSDDINHPNREIMAYVFYPTDQKQKKQHAPYSALERENLKQFFNKTTGLPTALFTSFAFVNTNSELDTNIAQTKTKFPLIIFLPGQLALPRSYTWLLEELASHGFVVVGLNQTYITEETHFPDGRVAHAIHPEMKKKFKNNRQELEKWSLSLIDTYVQDTRFAIDTIQKLAHTDNSFWSAVDIDSIGVLGHSYGGSSTIRTCKEDVRVRCAIDMDGSIRAKDASSPFTKPCLFMIGEKSHVWEKTPTKAVTGKEEEQKLHPKEVKLTKFASDGNMHVVTIPKAGHSAFFDIALLLNSSVVTKIISYHYNFFLGGPSWTISDILINNISPTVVTFFETYLKNTKE